MATPRKDARMPNSTVRDGFSLKMIVETNMDHIAVVLTSTVALIIVVSKTAETKSMKWSPNKTPSTAIWPMSRRIVFQSDDLRVVHRITAKITDATTKRQKAIEKTLTPIMRLMKIAAVPKRVPATMPSRIANSRLRCGIISAPLLPPSCFERRAGKRLRILGSMTRISNLGFGAGLARFYMDGLSNQYYEDALPVDTRRLALLSVLTALCMGIQLLLRPMNAEFTSLISFATGMVFGSLYGASLGILVMFVNGFLSPYGFAGVVLPFQIIGMGSIGLVGGLYARITHKGMRAGAFIEAAVLGAFLTFIYDVLTNVGTAVHFTLTGMPFSEALVAALVSGALPAAFHVVWNAVLFGTVSVPLVNAMHEMLAWR